MPTICLVRLTFVWKLFAVGFVFKDYYQKHMFQKCERMSTSMVKTIRMLSGQARVTIFWLLHVQSSAIR